eukprot:211371_1
MGKCLCTRMNGGDIKEEDDHDANDSHDTEADDDDISDAQKDNANGGYKQQLDSQTEKIQELSEEIVNIEQERHETDKEYAMKIKKLNVAIKEMKQINIEQTKTIQKLREEIVNIEQERHETDKEYEMKIKELNVAMMEQTKKINEKDDIISTMQEEMKRMSQSLGKLEKELSMNAIFYKVKGDSVPKLKYNKESNKFVVFVAGINHLFYCDVNGAKDQKYIVVKDISINDNSIQKSMNKPWFLIIGHKRSALFASDSQ